MFNLFYFFSLIMFCGAAGIGIGSWITGIFEEKSIYIRLIPLWLLLGSLLFLILGNDSIKKDYNNVESHSNICELGVINYLDQESIEIEREDFKISDEYFTQGNLEDFSIGDKVEFCYKQPHKGNYLTYLDWIEYDN